jgi:hypothetical protein
MKRQSESPSCVGATSALAVLLFSFGCVDLDKPENVRICAGSTAGCSDSPKSSDAGTDVSKDSADAPVPDAPSADGRDALIVIDLGSDSPGVADAVDGLLRTDSIQIPVDAGEADGPAPDVQELDTGVEDLLTTSDLPVALDLSAVPDLPPLSDLPVVLDLATPDLPGPDGPDVGSDTSDALSDTQLDVSPDQGRLDAQPANCVTEIVNNGYKAGTAPACSACNDGHGLVLATQCTGMVDCLVPSRTPADFTNCLNFVHGSSLVSDCVTKLINAGCPAAH